MNAKILVVDDDAAIRALISTFLGRSGFVVETATDGFDALEKIDHAHYDAMVLDIMMPRVDGFGVLERLRSSNSDLPSHTVVVTAFPDAALKTLGLSCRILSKPFGLDELRAAVDACLDGKSDQIN